MAMPLRLRKGDASTRKTAAFWEYNIMRVLSAPADSRSKYQTRARKKESKYSHLPYMEGYDSTLYKP